MKIAANISLVSEISDSPHFHDRDWERLMEQAASLGYDGIEIFPKSAEEFPVERLCKNLDRFGLELCVIGSGAGKALHGYTFTDPDAAVREKAVAYVSALVEVAGEFGAMMMVGSMQGTVRKGASREEAMGWLVECVSRVAALAAKKRVTLVLEPINRYETNLVNTLQQGRDLIHAVPGLANVKLVADLFHMNIEETSLEGAILEVGNDLAHFHFADSNRLVPGLGHIDWCPVAQAMQTVGYQGYLSVECFTGCDSSAALKKSKEVFDQYFNQKNL